MPESADHHHPESSSLSPELFPDPMPTVRITNRTTYPLNIALSHLCPVHFANAIGPGATWETHTGNVWFTVECRIDHGPGVNRYTAVQSARTIALVSLAGVSCAAVLAPLAIAGAATAGSATAAGLLANSAVVAGAASAETLSVTSTAASFLSIEAFKQVCRDNEMAEPEIDSLLGPMAMASGAMLGPGPSATAKKNITTKALGMVLAAFMSKTQASQTAEDKGEHGTAEGKSPTRGFADGKTQRVYGVYMAWRSMNFSIREVRDVNGVSKSELWDEDKRRIVA
ncbi:hypothetical protein BOTBODRAFT_39779 [Botryobasidium botryosum FD-172 SS1]|uniref:Uncharacterized protein n=1 Tax=Botryobasidium botryosum (strain FD-172 SS1) TaxID=930990 RepID=A0A067LSG0_BOTB1|nr:hypothetical protein BOTBODRAFT_39779 [Botryobasidium botryosum FD-172 SS1]